MIRTLSSRVVYENRWMRVREDEIERPDGSHGIYAVIDKEQAALIVPWDGTHLHLVGQYRYTHEAFEWEFPMGSVQADVQPQPEEIARTELAEELGLRAGRLQHLGFLWFASGMSSQGCDVWLATELEQGTARPEEGEVGVRQRTVTPDEFTAMIRDGELLDSATLAAWALLDARGLRP